MSDPSQPSPWNPPPPTAYATGTNVSGYQAGPPGPWGPPPQPPERPPTIRAAVAVMWVGAVVSVLGGFLGFFTRDQIREAVEDQLATQPDSGLDVDTFVTIGLISAVVGGLIGAGLWVLHAVFIGKGKSWARILGTILFAITFTFFFVGLIQPAPAISRVSAVVNLLVSIAAVVLIWLKPSSEYFAAHDRARRGY